MKRDPAIFRILALFAMLALFAASFFFDRLVLQIRTVTSQTFDPTFAIWTRMGLGMLTVLLSVLLALWVLAGSARGPLVHWVFLILGLLISFYTPIQMSGAALGMLLPSAGLLILGDNIVTCARILAVAGMLGLLLRPQKQAASI
jgi:hypothetical protein